MESKSIIAIIFAIIVFTLTTIIPLIIELEPLNIINELKMLTKKEILTKVAWAVLIILFSCGIFMIAGSKSVVEYSTDEYWVAKDYHHVYEKYSGEIVNVISDDETCKIVGDTITVITTKKPLYLCGLILSIVFGTVIVVLIYINKS